jgi:hypothetical protein
MTSLNSENQVLKTDARGRVRVPRERRAALLAEFAASAMSAAQFARLTGVNYQTFAGWIAKQRKERRAQVEANPAGATLENIPLTRPPVRLFEAVLGPIESGGGAGASGAGLTLDLPGGARTLVGSPVQLRLAAELLGLLAKIASLSYPSHVEL